jgi:YihY family inner membrane protein
MGVPKQNIWRRRLRGLEVVGVTFAIGLAGFFISGGLAALAGGSAGRLLGTLLALAINTGLFLAVYSVALGHKRPTRDLVAGALLAAVLWHASQLILQYYFQSLSSANELYGIFGAIISLLLWLYIGGMIIFLGAELTVCLETSCGSA